MPRVRKDNRGGVRQGTPGTLYPNRSDLAQNQQPVQAVSGQPYGQRGAQEAAQRAMPLPGAQAFLRPSERPGEPVTAGAPLGPGPGPEAVPGLQGFAAGDELLGKLRALYRMYPIREIGALLEQAYEDESDGPMFGQPPGVYPWEKSWRGPDRTVGPSPTRTAPMTPIPSGGMGGATTIPTVTPDRPVSRA